MARLAALFSLLLASSAEAKVDVFSSATFDANVVASNDQMWLVYFFAPWCGHCKRLAPVVEEVAELPEFAKIRCAKVDCTVDKALCSRYNVSGYPSILFMQGGRTWDYKGSRTKPGLLALAARMTKPSVRTLRSRAELDAMVAPDEAKVAFVYGRATAGDPADDIVAEAARARQHVDTFASSQADDVVAAAGGGAEPPFFAKVEKGEAPIVLRAASLRAMDPAALAQWIGSNRVPLCSLIDRHNFYELSSAGKLLVVLIVDPTAYCEPALSPAECDERGLREGDGASADGAVAALRSLSRDAALQADFNFGVLDGRKWREYVEDHVLSVDVLPRVLVLQHKPRAFFNDAPGDAASVASMAAFLANVKAGRVRAEYEDAWGMPDRWWRTACKWAPPLATLDFLPRYSGVLLGALLALWLLFKIICFEPMPEDFAPAPPTPPSAQPPRAKMKKVD